MQKNKVGESTSIDMKVQDVWKHKERGKQISPENPQSPTKNPTDSEVVGSPEKDYSKLIITKFSELKEDLRKELRESQQEKKDHLNKEIEIVKRNQAELSEMIIHFGLYILVWFSIYFHLFNSLVSLFLN